MRESGNSKRGLGRSIKQLKCPKTILIWNQTTINALKKTHKGYFSVSMSCASMLAVLFLSSLSHILLATFVFITQSTSTQTSKDLYFQTPTTCPALFLVLSHTSSWSQGQCYCLSLTEEAVTYQDHTASNCATWIWTQAFPFSFVIFLCHFIMMCFSLSCNLCFLKIIPT